MTPYARIIPRYIAGYLLLKGILPQEIADMIANDPEVSAACGALIMILVEGLYRVAKKLGWNT